MDRGNTAEGRHRHRGWTIGTAPTTAATLSWHGAARAIAAVALVLASIASGDRAAADEPITTPITFAREVRAILQTRCTACHAAGGSAPMPLTTYEEVRPWARDIKQQILSRRMPKWHAARGFGAFKNDPTLTPLEISMLVAWVDGGLPQGQAGRDARRANAVRPTPGTRAVVVRAGWNNGTARAPGKWVSGWTFEPGDPLIASAIITSGDGPVATWVAGDPPVTLPAGSAVRISSPLRVTVHRRAAADFERRFKRRPSVLRLTLRRAPPQRRVWTEALTCGAPRTGTAADVLAVRPLLNEGGSARLWLERPGVPALIVGWFRAFESAFPRTYWLTRPADLPTEARFHADGPCALEVTLARAAAR